MKPLNTFLFLLAILVLLVLFKHKSKIIIEWNNLWVGTIEIDTEDTIASKVFIDSLKIAKLNDHPVEKLSDSISNITLIDTLGYLLNGAYLEKFNQKLNQTADTLMRVLYIGDSQLEGDHVTYSLRKVLQSEFGGSGVGYLQLKTLYNSSAGVTIITNDFGEEAIHKRSRKNSKFGIFGKWYVPIKEQSKVTLKLKPESQNFNCVQLFYEGNATLNIKDEKECSIDLNRNFTKIKIEPGNENQFIFSEDQDFKIYGFMINTQKGIAVDNVPFRGVMNPNYYLQDTTLLQQMNDSLNIGLIVLHYGVNVVNDIRNSYSNYQIALTRDIQFLKKEFPESSIMIVSTSDMAHKVDGEMVSFENIGRVLKVQKQVSIENNIAYWDLHGAMGGIGSMVKWHDKGWARPDYVHLSKAGTNYIGELMARDLINNYKARSIKQ